MKRNGKYLLVPSMVWLAVFFVIPMLIVVAVSFASRTAYGQIVFGWTFQNYALHQNRIQHALAAENDHPRIGADKEIDPERNHTEDQPFLPQTAGEPGDAVCQRIAHKDGTYRGYDGYENCPSKNGNIKRIIPAPMRG